MMKNVIVLLFIFVLTGCYTNIVDNVTARESIRIESILIENGIVPKSIASQDGYSIQVKSGDRLRAISLLNYYELPSTQPVDIKELFPPGELVASPFAERNRLIYGIANSLERTIETIPGVISASVDLAYISGTVTTATTNNKASIVIVYQSPLDVDADFIEKVKAIVVNANPDILFNNVSVSAFKKEYVPITRDLMTMETNNLDMYIYLFVFIVAFMIISLVAYTYGRDRVNKSQTKSY